MKVLLVNKFYYPFGGTERYLQNLTMLLEKKGHTVIPFSTQNPQNWPTPYARYFAEGMDISASRRRNLRIDVRNALKMLYSFEAERKITRLAADVRPEIAHARNVYHQLSPSVLWGLKAAGVPIVLTIADYKLICPSYALYWNGAPCEACKGMHFHHAALRKCMRGSRIDSILLALESTLHQKILRSYQRTVATFISPSRFLREKLIEFGWPSDRLVHVPHFYDPSGAVPEYESEKEILYFGRIDHRKGLATLIRAVAGMGDAKVILAGDGPEVSALESLVEKERISNVTFVGFKHRKDLQNLIRRARCCVMPSESYETFGNTILEAYAYGKPVVASRIGAFPELVREGDTGYLFDPGNADQLREKLHTLMRLPRKAQEMGAAARGFVESAFSPERHYQTLMNLYSHAIG